MNVVATIGALTSHRTEALIVGLFEGEKGLPGSLRALDKGLGGLLGEVLSAGDFTGKATQTFLCHSRGAIAARRVLLVGLGKRQAFTLDRLRQAAGRGARAVRDCRVAHCAIYPAGVGLKGIGIREAAQAVTEGAILGLYQFGEYKTEEREELREVKEVTVLWDRAGDRQAAREGVRVGTILAEATNFARDVVNRPGNSATPSALARTAEEMARAEGLHCQILGKEEIVKLGMGGLLGVAQGSQEPPWFIILEHRRGARKGEAPVVVVGKGITFDSGGISLKPAEKMDLMKYDKSGGVAVLGILRAVARLRLPRHVVGLVPTTENLPSGTAYRPGDILRSHSGKTIEVVNTDAEGRLILADALSYALRYKPAAIVDLATLTGACVVALGNLTTGVMGNDAALIRRLIAAGERTAERVWELPLWEEYYELIKSDVADVKNVGGREAGAITGGAFLGRFVGNTPWAHLDIAGTAWAEKERPYVPRGATGVGVRLITEFLQDGVGRVRRGRGRIRG